MIFPQNRIFVIGSGICGALLLAEVVMLATVAVRLSNGNQDLSRAKSQLLKLQQREVYPSETNVNVLRANLDELDYRIGAIESELARDPFPQDAVEAAEFSARAQDVIERFRKRASQAGMVLPESLEVGFAQYASGGALPQPDQVPRLLRQLYSVERVADVLVQGGVTSVESMTRELFEGQAAPDMPPRRRSGNAARSKVRKPLPLLASEVSPDDLYFIERIGISFTAPEEVIWRVLDLFAAAPHFMVVAEFSHRTKSDILSYNPSALKQAGDQDNETLRFLAEGVLTGDKALSRPERIIAGAEEVQAQLTINVYNFLPAEDQNNVLR